MDQGTGRYAAFLSYSHKDGAAARWLHRRLETYRIPKRLVGAKGEWGPVPARLTPIFRDREELPATGDLSERVRAALAVSDHLVILCSPAAASSPWVAKEIAAFREIHPGRPVFAAIVEGDPAQCFPPNLAAGRAEPLAADLRPGRDGRRLGFLKLVAGLSGTGLDALVQRYAQRRIRSVMAITALALAAMLVMAVLTGIALTQRREAQRQRAEAEGLVEFMLTDLRDRLKTVGRLDIMEAVNQRALARYRRQDLRRLDDDSLERRARILQIMGDDDEKLGRLDGALSEFIEAHRATGALLARSPHSLERILAHGRSNYWIGRVHELRQEWPEAQAQYALFASAADRLISSSPTNRVYMDVAASSAVNLGNVQLNGTKDYAAAEHSYEKALVLYQRLTQAGPSDGSALRDEANAYGWLADSFFMRSLWAQSLSARSRQYEILEPLHRSAPENVEITYRLALAERGLARSLKKAGNFANAKAHLFAAYDWSHRLNRYDPENAEWLLFRGFISCDLYYSGFVFPQGLSKIELSQEIRNVSGELTSKKYSRLNEISHCVTSLPRPTP
ncbi:MAG: hypothetical protein JWO81_524 [Alphaproteobacteria bacterium]|nr:hypothetical protein [Alphaproteobacteria bacterium]